MKTIRTGEDKKKSRKRIEEIEMKNMEGRSRSTSQEEALEDQRRKKQRQ